MNKEHRHGYILSYSGVFRTLYGRKIFLFRIFEVIRGFFAQSPGSPEIPSVFRIFEGLVHLCHTVIAHGI